MARWPNKTAPTATEDVRIPAERPFDMNALVNGGPDILEVPPSADLQKLISGFEGEAFMNELLTIVCRANGDPHAPKAVEIHVDTGGITGPMGAPTAEYPDGVPGKAGRGGKGVNLVFAYDKHYIIPRFIYEVMAHSKTTTLRQMPHPTKPMELVQQNVNTFSYNFECIRDPNPKGQEWREKVLADRA